MTIDVLLLAARLAPARAAPRLRPARHGLPWPVAVRLVSAAPVCGA